MPFSIHAMLFSQEPPLKHVVQTWDARGGGLAAFSSGDTVTGFVGTDLAPDLVVPSGATGPTASSTAMPGILVPSFSTALALATPAALPGNTWALLLVISVDTLADGDDRTIFAIPASGGTAAYRIKVRAVATSKLYVDLIVATDGGDETVSFEVSSIGDDKAITILAKHDRLAKSLSINVDDGTAVTGTYTGTAVEEAGAAVIGNGLAGDSEATQDGVIAIALVRRVFREITSADEAVLWASAASQIAPVAKAALTSISFTIDTEKDVAASDLCLDPAGYGIACTSADVVPDGMTMTISSSKLACTVHTQAPLTPTGTITSSHPLGPTTSVTFVTAVAQTTAPWPNGYTTRWDKSIDPSVLSDLITADITSAIVFVYIDDPAMKSTGNGGVVTGSGGEDIRVEDGAGTKLSHVRVYWAAASSKALLAVRLTPLPVLGQTIYVYAGKSGASDEADATGLSSTDLLAMLDPHSGTDLSSNSNDQSPTGVSAGTGLLVPDATMSDGTAVMEQADATWTNTLAAITSEIFCKPSSVATDIGMVGVGTLTTDASAVWGMRGDAVGAHGGAANTICAQFQTSAGGIDRFEGSAGDCAAGEWHLYSTSWASGKALEVARDGVQLVKTNTSDGSGLPITGALGGGDVWSYRAGNNVAFKGDAQIILWWNRKVGLSELKIRARNLIYAQAFCNASAAAAITDSSVPAVPPIYATVTPGGTIDLDPVSIAIGPASPTLSSPSASAGTVSIVGGKIHFVAPSTAQTVTISYTLTSSPKSLTGYCIVTVAGSSAPSSDTAPWDGALLLDPTAGVSPQATQIKQGTGVINGYQWTAHRTGYVTGLRLIMRAAIAGGPTGAGYTTGPGAYSYLDGGAITLKLCAQNSDGTVGTVLGTGPLNNGLAGNLCAPDGRQNPGWGFYDVWTLNAPTLVTKGQKYWFQFVNTGSSGGWISMDTMSDFAPVPLGLTPPQRSGIFYGDDLVCHGRYAYGSGPDLRNNVGGLFVVHYQDGINDGIPFQFSASEARKTAGGSTHLRQRFTITYATVQVSGLWVRCWWTDPATTSLLARLENSAGALMQGVTFVRSSFTQGPNSQSNTTAYPIWAKADFGSLATLTKGQEYFLHFSASAGGYEFCPKQLYAGGDGCRNAPTGYADYSTDGGSTWKPGWDRNDQAGSYQTFWWLNAALVVAS